MACDCLRIVDALRCRPASRTPWKPSASLRESTQGEQQGMVGVDVGVAVAVAGSARRSNEWESRGDGRNAEDRHSAPIPGTLRTRRRNLQPPDAACKPRSECSTAMIQRLGSQPSWGGRIVSKAAFGAHSVRIAAKAGFPCPMTEGRRDGAGTAPYSGPGRPH
jgi:hypothetical protein